MQKIDDSHFIGSDTQYKDTESDFNEYVTGFFIGLINNFKNSFDFNKYDGYRVRLLSDSGRVLADSIDIDHSGFREDIFRKATALSDFQYEEMFKFGIGNDDYFTGHDYYDSIFYPYKEYTGQEILDARENGYGAKIRYSLDYSTTAVLYSAMPIYIDNKIFGYILFSQNFYSHPINYWEWIWILLDYCFVSFVIAIPIIFILLRRLVHPLLKLSKQAKSVIDKKGRIQKTVLYASKRKDEIGDLSRSFTTLISRLNDRIHYVETFSSDVAHEFKNPLAAIRSAVEIMNEPGLNDEEKDELYTSINDEVHHLEVLLKDIRDISKIENQDDDYGKENIPIGLLAGNIIKRVSQNYTNVTFDLKCRAMNKSYFAKASNLDRMLENLIDNAASFAIKNEQKNVNVSIIFDEEIKSLTSALLISVEDSGPGVPAGEEDKIFTRFYSHRDDTQKKNHSGLGLSTVKAIVESMNGQIIVKKSDSLGGAMFIVTLP
ncbi:HAMP domain-containing sensor histidine kinase [uncultured Treponema sp.]|uniref:HAMP domain-containing sensor histidine kinase n=1 Tax=uncultured Treponema sp. TaxID=162155 RepID=UPI0025F17E69|nr:HAMP domain-containing sensor histidine kinase [uncultured Treponema sp.]